MKDVIVFGGTTLGSVLDICEVVRNNGAKTYVITFDGLEYSDIYRSSVYVTDAFSVEPESLQTFLTLKIQDGTFDNQPIMYFTTDESCLLINRNRDWYEKYFTLCLPSSYIVESFNDKSAAAIEAKKNGLLVPETTVIKNRQDKSSVETKFNFPVVLKPITYKNKKELRFKYKIAFHDEFDQSVNQILSKGDNVLCQEYIIGEDTDIWFYIFYRSSEGIITRCTGRKKVQANGIMAVGETLYNSEVDTICTNFINRIDYVGIGGIELKCCNNMYYFIEMSTRLEGFHKISSYSNCHISQSSYYNLCDSVYESKGSALNNIVYYALFPWLFHSLRNFSLSFIKDLCNLIFTKMSFMDCTFRDIRPYIKCFNFFIKRKYHKSIVR